MSVTDEVASLVEEWPSVSVIIFAALSFFMLLSRWGMNVTRLFVSVSGIGLPFLTDSVKFGEINLSAGCLGRDDRANEGVGLYVNHRALGPVALVRHLGRNQYVVTCLHNLMRIIMLNIRVQMHKIIYNYGAIMGEKVTKGGLFW